MPKIARTISLMTLALATGLPEVVLARSKPAYMPIGAEADAPFGFVEMCARDKALCLLGAAPNAAPARFELAGGMASEMTGATGALRIPAVATVATAPTFLPLAQPPGRLTDEKALRNLAKRINSHVNRSVMQVPDHVATGFGEFWSRPGPGRGSVGDCEDVAIEKRAQLTAAGFPAERMSYAVSFVRGYGLHTVLIVRLDDGDYILDSMVAQVRRWSATKQVWLRRQVPGAPLKWVRVDGIPAPGLVATSTETRVAPS